MKKVFVVFIFLLCFFSARIFALTPTEQSFGDKFVTVVQKKVAAGDSLNRYVNLFNSFANAHPKYQQLMGYIVSQLSLGLNLSIQNTDQLVACYSEKYEHFRDFTFSSDGVGFAFIGQNANGKFTFVKDGVESDVYDDIYNLTFSADWTSYSFSTKKDGNYITIKDGSKIYDSAQPIIYSPYGHDYISPILIDGKYTIFHNSSKLGVYSIVIYPQYSSDGKSFAFIAEKGGKTILVKDGVEITSYDSISRFFYSSDGKKFAFIAEKDGKQFVVKDGVKTVTYDNIYDFQYSPDGNHFAFTAKKNGKQFVVRDGVEGIAYDIVHDLQYSLDGKSLSYTANRDGKNLIVKDGKESGKYYGDVYEKKYLSSGDLVFLVGGYPIEGERYYLFKNSGIETGKYYNASNFIYSSDGKSFAFTVREDGKRIVVKDRKESKQYATIDNLGYSSDGKSFSFVANKSTGKEVLVKDGIELGMSKYYNIVYKYLKSPVPFVFQANMNWGSQNTFLVFETNDTTICSRFGLKQYK